MDSDALLELARRRVDAVCADVHGIRDAAHALADETAWQSRAAEAFRLAVGDWTERLDLLAAGADGLCDDLATVRVRGVLEPGAW